MSEVPRLTHLDAEGKATMVDVSAKPIVAREAEAEARLRLQPETRALIQEGGVPKGDVFAVARIAGIQAAKDTARLIPLCHSLPLSSVAVNFGWEGTDLCIRTRARTVAQTGVEMEALTAASIAALTVYDMCKAVDHQMEIHSLRLLRKVKGTE